LIIARKSVDSARADRRREKIAGQIDGRIAQVKRAAEINAPESVRGSLKMSSRSDTLQETSIGGSMTEEMYFEDFYPGQKFNSLRNYRVTAREIISFGQSYDPQPFHIDEGAGENSFFSGLCASGWLTAAIVMRLRVESIKVKGGMIGAGVDEMRWTHPVRPEDKLRTESEVLEARRSVNRSGYGVVRSRTTVFNQRNETVMKSIVNWLAPLRNPDL
jgi:acyl dehydratase